MTLDEVLGLRLAVWGVGAEGVALLALARARGVEPLLIDDHPERIAALEDPPVGLVLPEDVPWSALDVVVRSPGVSRYRPELAAAEVALRLLNTAVARAAFARAREAAEHARVPSLLAEVAEARAALDRPAARSIQAGQDKLLRLDEVEVLHASGSLVIDGCRRGLRVGSNWLPLARRPLLFALARALAEAWPGDVDRNLLITRAFSTRHLDETHRARLRVEIGRLRAIAAPLARIEASARGFALRPLGDHAVVVLLPPIEGDQASLLALLADGLAWSTSALALALGDSQRTVQRALVELEAEGRVRSIGLARSQRWLSPPLTGFTTNLLLPAALALG